MNLGQAYETDEASPGQRARRHELMEYCKRKGIKVKGDATKDEILKLVDVQPMIQFDVPDIPRKGGNPDLETDDDKRARLTVELAKLDKPKIFGTDAFKPRTPLEDEFHKLDQMKHHERKKWLVKTCEEKGIECRFPGPRGKGPEVLDECKRIAAM